MLTPNDPIGSTLFPVARLMQLQAAEELVERAVRAAESASDLLKAARRERDEAKARVAALEEERARLSKTTDGVVPGFEDTLYLLYRQPSGLMVIASDHQDFRDFHSPDKPTHWVGIYSTRAAAERAKGGE